MTDIRVEDGKVFYTPTKADFEKDQEAREAIWREQAQPVYSNEDGTFEAWAMDDLRHRPKPRWLIDNIVEEEGLTVFFAGDKLGKTAVLSSILWSWVAGHEFFLDEQYAFRDPTNEEPRKVLYVLLEGTGTYWERFDSWRRRFADADTILPNFVVTTSPLQLWKQGMDLGDADTWPESMIDLADAVATIRPHILVVDTFARATPGVDENSSQIGAVVGALDHFRNSYGIATILVHHTPIDDRSKRPRGWGGLKAAASSYVWITGDQEEKIKTFGTGPHRNADFTRTLEFVTKPFAKQFVVERPAPSDLIKNEGQQEMLEILQRSGAWMARNELHDESVRASTANDRLIALENMGAVESKQVGNSKLWRAAQLEDL